MADFKLTYATMFSPPAALHTRFEEALRKVRQGLGQRHPLWVQGQDLLCQQESVSYNPACLHEALGTFQVADEQDVDRAVQAAHRAWASWRQTPWQQRAQAMRRVAQLIEERVYDIAAALVLEVGKNRMEALGEVQETAEFFNIYADQMAQHQGYDHRLPNDPLTDCISQNRSVLKPYGVWAVIAPFNYPFALAGGPTAAALVAGNTVVMKGSASTPWSGRLLAECLRDADLPPGVFNYLNGDGPRAGEALATHPLTAGITFTGSHEVGLRLSELQWRQRRMRPLIAEMGGKNAVIITAHARIEDAVLGIVRSAFGMQGQKCSALSRIYVDEHIADALIDTLQQHMQGLSMGDPSRQENWLGPVATKSAYQRYARCCQALQASGAQLLCGGKQWQEGPMSQGYFCAPTLAQAPVAHALWQEELFLPVVMLHRVRNKEEAMSLANDSALGLTGGLYGSDSEVNWFFDHIEAGVTYANRPQGATTGAWPGYQPFGGWKGSGSTGKALASFYYLPQYMREQSQTQVLHR